MALSNDRRHLAAYLLRALRPTRHDYGQAVREAFQLLERLEVERAGLIDNLEKSLSDRRTFQGSENQRLLQHVITTVSGCPSDPRCSPLGDDKASRRDDPGEIVLQAELIEQMMDAIAELPDRDRRLLAERYWEGKSNAEASRSVGLSRQRGHEVHERAICHLTARLAAFRES